MDKTKRQLPDPESFTILSPDETLLDKEWIAQPRLYFKWAFELAQARRRYEEAKANLKLVAAEADRKVRAKAAAMEEKIREADVAASIERRSDYKEAEQMVFDAKYQIDVLDAVVTALDHRKKALENLVFLHGQSYFATPQAKGENSRHAVEDMKMRQTVRDRNRRVQ